ncbi:Structural maintenance of chromosomes protein 2 [Quaeritorhiza haematococci]|nr:Structural maintenance of chromosomes protein 2 [Quaeritorhiza haematococci]
MYIEEVIIDGFKSYASRTVIAGWDPEFNAITGLNGSGKSNVLDSICFVLGIQNIGNLRASSLQDLIYKKGQAGITKASVTIVFNNDDRSRSPVGYEDCKQVSVTRQIMVGGRNKYIINGSNAQQNKVFDLFQSVQLNVNNPHFLIMQGRITKVLNMKPPEILAMIEEAAGTRMFEDHKDKALKTMVKKDAKLTEINELLENFITPRLEKLKAQKRDFLEFKRIETELDHLDLFVTAWEYWRNETMLEKSHTVLEQKQQQITNLEEAMMQLDEDMKNIDAQIVETHKIRDKDNSKFDALESTHKEFQKQLVKIETQRDLKATSIQEEIKNRNTLLNSKKEAEEAIADSVERHRKLCSDFDSIKQAHESQVEQVRKQEELLQTLKTGMAAAEGHENGYMDQLQEARNDASSAASEFEQAQIKIAHLKKELQENLPKAKKAEKQNAGLVADLAAGRKAVEKLEKELSSISWDSDKEVELMRHKSERQSAIQSLQERIDHLEGELAALKFNFADPVPNFDRSQVKGLVAELVKIPKGNLDTSTALEVCAGSRLYNVVVSSEVVGTQLLEKGQLKRRVTIIPLNKIASFKVQAERIATAGKVAPGDARLALHLIGYEEEVLAAMQYVFGMTLICKDPTSAKKVTFHPNIKMRSVTLDGDIYDPSGSLSGGSKPNSSGVLLKLQTLSEFKSLLATQQTELNKVLQELSACHKTMTAYNKTKQALDLKVHEVKLLEEQIGSNSNSRVIQLVEQLKTDLQKEEENVKECQRRKAEALKRCQSIEKEMDEFMNHREEKLKSLEADLAKKKSALQKNAPRVKEKQVEIDVVQGEIKQFEADVKSIEEQLENLTKLIEQYTAEEKELKNRTMEIKRQCDDAEAALNRERASLSAYDEKLKYLESLKQKNRNELEDAKLQHQKLVHELQEYDRESKRAEKRVAELNKKYPWIQDQKQLSCLRRREKEPDIFGGDLFPAFFICLLSFSCVIILGSIPKTRLFGKPETQYDFEKQDPAQSHQRRKQLAEQRDALRKTVNTDAMQDFEIIEKKEVSLKNKLVTINRDKRKIEDTIKELDQYKRETLQRTWEKVNRDFGGIFGDLLPGNTSKLEPPEGQDITQGLEVKVNLGGVWKKSLTELSGGQRSLIALSLILALLQFKPAPMYILDEVDAALDLSHTQNIGHLFRNRFKGAQFIVVSLKEGMFNNANVLFRTRVRDGVSTVERFAQKHKERSKDHRGDGAPPNSRRKSIVARMSMVGRRLSMMSDVTALPA